MKKTLVFVFAIIIGIAFAATGFAAGDKTTYTGEVSNVDTGAKTLVVKGADGEKTFDLSDAKFKGYKSMNDLKSGDKVTVSYTTKNGTMAAKRVEKSKAEKKGKTKTKTDTEK